jgi:hypothetical protein
MKIRHTQPDKPRLSHWQEDCRKSLSIPPSDMSLRRARRSRHSLLSYIHRWGRLCSPMHRKQARCSHPRVPRLTRPAKKRIRGLVRAAYVAVCGVANLECLPAVIRSSADRERAIPPVGHHIGVGIGAFGQVIAEVQVIADRHRQIPVRVEIARVLSGRGRFATREKNCLSGKRNTKKRKLRISYAHDSPFRKAEKLTRRDDPLVSRELESRTRIRLRRPLAAKPGRTAASRLMEPKGALLR